ncbi:MAG: hypothetical protein EVB11_12625 [Winogradskyella sp.]|nr:MAG: hypothetical protein EVB11_12625 [Winogradskyella sp.]
MRIIKLIISLFILVLFMNCVQDTKSKTITLTVDMNGIENVENVGVRGSNLPLSWKETIFLTDEDNDGIYQKTFSINTASYDLEFKFVKNSDFFELENQNNRSIVFEYKPETITYKATFNNQEEKIIRK